MSLRAYTETIIVSKMDDEHTILDIFHQVAQTDPDATVSLTNIFKELPISNNATIIEAKGSFVSLETRHLQLAAINNCKEVLIQAPFFSSTVIGRLHSMDVRRDTVTLTGFSYAEIHLDKRAAVRVRFPRPLHVMVEAEGNKVSGVISDISLSGCCINILVNEGLTDTVSMNLKYIQQGSGQVLETRIPARVIRVDGESAPYRCILVFEHSANSEQTLSSFIYQRQVEILNELRESL